MRNKKGQFLKGIHYSARTEFKKGNIPPFKKIRIKKECLICKTIFYVPKAREKTAKFCSKPCARKSTDKKKYKKRRPMNLKEKQYLSNYWKEKVKKGLHHLYKGGITSLMIQIRGCFQYRLWRSDVYQKDNFTCQKCGVRSGNGKHVYLEAHHLKEFSKIIEENNIKIL